MIVALVNTPIWGKLMDEMLISIGEISCKETKVIWQLEWLHGEEDHRTLTMQE